MIQKQKYKKALKIIQSLRQKKALQRVIVIVLRLFSLEKKLVVMMSRIVAHNRLRDGSLENATCARELTEQKPTRAGGNLDCSVDSARFLAFTR